ncbi:hypothetical protein BOTBODRAFT_26557 [Botryobasidium botryosum FD-172 SS1]|uniref:High-temperature-induced dauer-formation protein-domain-containing protein n=1 Tax=Botryobasidium botryosum (strain FD-172 SS1) TaxID=930990 RepID=A0A067MXQ3_BOTB1|nr:hypothetical protein BOTBODRAFT_26557 [Botryobasidium botryosum FD-172 SS1]
MFALPRKLSSPFGLLGDDAKLAFRTKPTGIARLSDTRNIPESDEYWSQYATIFDSASDVFSLITPQDVRRALTAAPENVATLVRALSRRLFNLVSDHTFPSPAQSTMSTLTTAWGSSERDTTKEVLNCLRVLGRVLPVLFEGEAEAGLEMDVLWKREPVKLKTPMSVTSDEPQFVIEEEDEDDDEDKPTASAPAPEAAPEVELLPCLAERLFGCVIDLLFCCGFTLPTKVQEGHHKINHIIWERGVGSTVDIGSSTMLDNNKTEVLRFLLILLSKTIYISPSTLLTQSNPYADYFARSTQRRLVLSILCSLLNTSMNARDDGWGLGGVVDKVPYNHLILARKGEEGRSGLVGGCLGALCALLDYQGGSARDVAVGDANLSGADVAVAPTPQSNAFRYFLAKLHRPADLEFILNGILSIFEQHLAAQNNLLPGSRKAVPYVLEAYVLFWKMIELNKKFRAYLLDSDKLLEVLAYMLCFCLELKDKPQHHGLCRQVSYMIQSLSAERAFGSKLSQPIPSRMAIPAKWATSGTAGDFMVTSIYAMVATTAGALNFLYPALIIALANVAPYLKNLGVQASARLVQLFTSFSTPAFLLADEGNPRLVFFILETLNGILYHQLAENPNVVYAILRSHKTFEDLGTFTLARGLKEIQRIQQAKEEQQKKQQQQQRDVKSPDPQGERRDEKAVLLDRERERESESEERIDSVRNSESEDHAAGGGTPSDSRAASVSGEGVEPDHGGTTGTPRKISEKARGKMRARSSESVDTTASLERLAAAGVAVGRNGFVPTQEWVSSWQQGLPLDPVLLTIAELLPKVHSLQASLNRPTTTPAILDFLRSVTLQHVLPPTPPLNPRKFLWSDASIVWLTSLLWGELYVRGTAPLGIWNSTAVRLFGVRHSPARVARGMSGAVSEVVGGLGLWGSTATATGGATGGGGAGNVERRAGVR